MVVSVGSNPSHQSHTSSREHPNPPDPQPPAEDFARAQDNTQNPGTDSTSTPCFTSQPRRIALQDPSPELFAENIRGPSTSAAQVDRDFYVPHPRDDQSNRSSALTDVASRAARASGPDSTSSENQQHQKSQTTSEDEAHTGEKSESSQKRVTKSHLSTESSSGTKPPAKKVNGSSYDWTAATDQFLLEKVPKVKHMGIRYRWKDLLEDFNKRGFEFEPNVRSLENRYLHLMGTPRKRKRKEKKYS